MTCTEARERFSALVDGELSTAERSAMDAHVAGCIECRRELDRFAATVAMVHTLPPERAPVGFVDRVVDAAHPVPWPRRLARRLFVPLRVKVPMHVAAALLVATTAVWVVQRTPELQHAARQKTPAAPPVTPRTAPPTVTSPASPRPPSAARSSDTPPQTPTALKDESTSSAPPREREANERVEHATTPRELESRRGEGDAAGAGAQMRAAEAPAPERDRVAKREAPATARPLEPDVVGTWRVEDRAAAARELEPLVARLGGGPVTRRTEGSVETVEFSVPRGAYDDLTNVLEWFGRLTVVPSPGALPPTVRVRLRITG